MQATDTADGLVARVWWPSLADLEVRAAVPRPGRGLGLPAQRHHTGQPPSFPPPLPLVLDLPPDLDGLCLLASLRATTSWPRTTGTRPSTSPSPGVSQSVSRPASQPSNGAVPCLCSAPHPLCLCLPVPCLRACRQDCGLPPAGRRAPGAGGPGDPQPQHHHRLERHRGQSVRQGDRHTHERESLQHALSCSCPLDR